ncbi:hypothetical protein IWX85_002477 [Polaromonas sp. CG_9.11]|nr:hypothetical protein [Polaromonas sp. CG_9.11]
MKVSPLDQRFTFYPLQGGFPRRHAVLPALGRRLTGHQERLCAVQHRVWRHSFQAGVCGLALLLVGLAAGGTLSGFTVKSTALLACLVVPSSTVFSLL